MEEQLELLPGHLGFPERIRVIQFWWVRDLLSKAIRKSQGFKKISRPIFFRGFLLKLIEKV